MFANIQFTMVFIPFSLVRS